MLRDWRGLAALAPRQATFTATAGGPATGHGDTMTAGFVWVGDPDAGKRLLPSLRALGRPVGEQVTEMSYLDLQQIDDDAEGYSARRYWKGHYLSELSDGAIEALLTAATGTDEGGRPVASLQAYGGAIADTADQDTAFSHRGTRFEFAASAGWSDPGQDAARMAAVRRFAACLDGFADGVYVNALSDEGSVGVRRAYPGAKLARLTALKDRYDPQNVFHLNHNIRPSAA